MPLSPNSASQFSLKIKNEQSFSDMTQIKIIISPSPAAPILCLYLTPNS